MVEWFLIDQTVISFPPFRTLCAPAARLPPNPFGDVDGPGTSQASSADRGDTGSRSRRVSWAVPRFWKAYYLYPGPSPRKTSGEGGHCKLCQYAAFMPPCQKRSASIAISKVEQVRQTSAASAPRSHVFVPNKALGLGPTGADFGFDDFEQFFGADPRNPGRRRRPHRPSGFDGHRSSHGGGIIRQLSPELLVKKKGVAGREDRRQLLCRTK